MTAAQGPDARTASATQPVRITSGTTGGAPAGGAPRPAGPPPSEPSNPSAPTRAMAAGPRPSPRPAVNRPEDQPARSTNKARKARLALKRIDPWSVFVFSLIASVLLGIALVAAVAALYAVLDSLGVQASVNELFDEVTSGTGSPLLSVRRVVGGAAVLAAVNVVLLTLLATLGSLLYNLCASFTGGIEVTLGERDG